MFVFHNAPGGPLDSLVPDLVRGGGHCIGGMPSLRGQPGSSRIGSVPGQFSTHPRQSHFGISSLEATLHRGLDLALSLGGTHALAEEIGVAAEVLGWRQRDCIDPVLDYKLAGGWEPRDPLSGRFVDRLQGLQKCN
jgi:hypothetical protein